MKKILWVIFQTEIKKSK